MRILVVFSTNLAPICLVKSSFLSTKNIISIVYWAFIWFLKVLLRFFAIVSFCVTVKLPIFNSISPFFPFPFSKPSHLLKARYYPFFLLFLHRTSRWPAAKQWSRFFLPFPKPTSPSFPSFSYFTPTVDANSIRFAHHSPFSAAATRAPPASARTPSLLVPSISRAFSPKERH